MITPKNPNRDILPHSSTLSIMSFKWIMTRVKGKRTKINREDKSRKGLMTSSVMLFNNATHQKSHHETFSRMLFKKSHSRNQRGKTLNHKAKEEIGHNLPSIMMHCLLITGTLNEKGIINLAMIRVVMLSLIKDFECFLVRLIAVPLRSVVTMRLIMNILIGVIPQSITSSTKTFLNRCKRRRNRITRIS